MTAWSTLSRVLLLLTLACAPLAARAEPACSPLLNQKFNSLQGPPANLCQYTGKVLLVVNTASYCGFTPQYKGLEALYEKYKDRGLVVLGFPANDFGGQEPGSNKEVADFCDRTYKVKFPMVEKTSVVPGHANAVFEQLAAMTGERPAWNFHKYLVTRAGDKAVSFPSTVSPDDPKLVAQLESLLGSP